MIIFSVIKEDQGYIEWVKYRLSLNPDYALELCDEP